MEIGDGPMNKRRVSENLNTGLNSIHSIAPNSNASKLILTGTPLAACLK